MTPTVYPHIVLKESGTPMIEGTRISVARIALDYTQKRYPPEEIPGHYGGLTLAQVFAALTYYFDNKEAMDRMIDEDDQQFLAEREASRTRNADLLAKLKTQSRSA